MGITKAMVLIRTCIAKNPLTNICALPQGDPWAPWAMALMLAPAIRKISEEIPGVFQVTYMDDRTALFRSTHDMTRRLQTNDSKTQCWGRTAAAKNDLERCGWIRTDRLHVLGSTLAHTKRSNSPEEETKYSAAEAKAARIAALPVSCALKQRLCATVLATKVSWGEVINGRRPMVQYCQQFPEALQRLHERQRFWRCPSLYRFASGLFPGSRFGSSLVFRASLLGGSFQLGTIEVFARGHGSYCSQAVLSAYCNPSSSSMACHRQRSGFPSCQRSYTLGCSKELVDEACHRLRATWRITRSTLGCDTQRSETHVSLELLNCGCPITLFLQFKVVSQNDAHVLAVVTAE